jgi:hypothetical protein
VRDTPKGFFVGKNMKAVEKATSVVMTQCDDGLKMVFSNHNQTTSVTMDWIVAAELTLRLDALGKEALTMMQMGLNPYRGEHRQSFILSQLQADLGECDEN